MRDYLQESDELSAGSTGSDVPTGEGLIGK